MSDAFILTWFPLEYDGAEEQFLDAVTAGHVTESDWSTGRTTKAIGPGSEIYLLRQGPEPRGIVAFGTAISNVFQQSHWDGSGRLANYVDVRWTTAVRRDEPLALADLKLIAPNQHWEPQGSGTRLRGEYANAVAVLWNAHRLK